MLSVSTIFITNGGVEQIETTKNADVTKYSQTEGARRRELIEIIYMQKRTKACRSSELTPSYQFLHALSKSNPMLHHFAWPPLGISNASKFIFGFFMPREMDLQFPIITLYFFFLFKVLEYIFFIAVQYCCIYIYFYMNIKYNFLFSNSFHSFI